jgi:hypothetical protein
MLLRLPGKLPAPRPHPSACFFTARPRRCPMRLIELTLGRSLLGGRPSHSADEGGAIAVSLLDRQGRVKPGKALPIRFSPTSDSELQPPDLA